MMTPKLVPRWSRPFLAAAWILSASVLAWSRHACGQENPPAKLAPFDFRGRFLVSVSDADMLPSAYIDGRLGPVDGADALSVIIVYSAAGRCASREIVRFDKLSE